VYFHHFIAPKTTYGTARGQVARGQLVATNVAHPIRLIGIFLPAGWK
jgi:hypothetical protein